MKYTETKGLAPAAEMSSCVLDLARWASFQMRDGTDTPGAVLKPATLREMHRVQWTNPDLKDTWGLRFAVWRQGERTIFGHGGALAGYRTQVAVSPDDKVAVVVLTNADDGRPGAFVKKAMDWVAPAIAKAAAPPAQAPQPDPEWSRYVGVYRSIWGDSQVLVMDGQLVLVDPTEDDPKESMLTLTPIGPRMFRESFSGAEGGDIVTFELGPDGKVARMKEGDNYSLPVSY